MNVVITTEISVVSDNYRGKQKHEKVAVRDIGTRFFKWKNQWHVWLQVEMIWE